MTTPTSTKRRQSEAAKAAGDRAVNFFCRRLHHPKGRAVGQAFIPTAEQAAWLRVIFGTLNGDGRRRYRTIYREIPKKNSKSTDTAGCLLKCLFDEEVHGGEAYSAAATRDQAGILYAMMASMVRRSPALYPKFRGKPVKLYDRDKRIYVAALDSFYQALSSDAGYSDGIMPSVAAVDELHRHKSRDLLDVIQEGMGTVDQPLLFILTTAGADQTGPAWDMHEYARQVLEGVIVDPTFYAQIYAAPEQAAWDDEQVWYDCNPMLRAGVLDIEDFRRAARQAKQIPSALRSFRRLRLNQWVAVDEKWLPMDLWDECGAEISPLNIRKKWAGRECFLGVDLSSTSDFTAVALLFPREDGGYDLQVRLYVPKDSLAERAEMGDQIADWARAGYVRLVPGTHMNYAYVAEDIRQDCLAFDVQEIGYDPWHAPNIINHLEDVPATMVKVSQYASVMNAPCRLMETLLADRALHHYGSPALRWMARNVVAETNAYEAMRPSKRASKTKIDGITATLIALERATAPKEKKGFSGVIAV